MKNFAIFARQFCVAVALLAAISSAAAQQKPPEPSDDEVIQVNTNLVTVPISVLDRNGRFIPGLTQDQFHLFENGVAQDIAYFDSADKPFTVALLLDISDSTKFKLKRSRTLPSLLPNSCGLKIESSWWPLIQMCTLSAKSPVTAQCCKPPFAALKLAGEPVSTAPSMS
jgi:hypothetical protein